MKKICSFLMFIAVAAMSFTSCEVELQEVDNGVAKKVISVIPVTDETKTTLNGDHSKLEWTAGDNFRLFTDANGNDPQTLTYSSADAVISATVSETSKNVYAYYFAGTYEYTNPTSYTTYINQKQTQSAAGVFNGQNLPMVGSGIIDGSAVKLQFKPIASVLALNIYSASAKEGEVIQSVKITPTNNTKFCGSRSTDLTAETVKYDQATSNSDYQYIEVTLDTPSAYAAAKPSDSKAYDGQIYAVIAKQSYKSVKFEITTNLGVYTITSSATTAIDCTANDFIPVNINLAKAVFDEKEPEPSYIYSLVTKALEDWRGDYLIAYSDDVFMDGSLEGGTSGVGKAQTHVAPEDALSSDKQSVTSTWGDKHYVTIEAIDDDKLSSGYVIKTHSTTTPYFYQTSNKNGMACTENKKTAAAYPITITFKSSNNIELALGGSANGAILHYNNNAGAAGEMFRFYKDGGQQAIYLYKKTAGTPTPVEKYAINIADNIQNGSIEAKIGDVVVTEAAENATVSIVASADEGYTMYSSTVTNNSTEQSIGIENNSFVMPASAVTISASFIPELVVAPMNPGNLASTAGTKDFTVTTVANDWTVTKSEGADWATISKSGNKFSVEYTANELEAESTEARSVVLTIESQQAHITAAEETAIVITLTQNGKEYVDLDGSLSFDFSLANPGEWPAPATNPTQGGIYDGDYVYTLDGLDYTFSLKNTIYKAPNTSSSGYLFMLSKTFTSAVGLPAVEGKRLIRVSAFAKNGGSTSVEVGIKEQPTSEAEYVCPAVKWSNGNQAYIYEIDNSEANTQYYLFSTVANAQITNITLTYEDATPKSISSLTLSGNYPTEFYVGDEFSHEGMTVTANYEDGTSKDVTSLATFTGYNSGAVSDSQTITVGYKSVTATYSVKIKAVPTYSVTVNQAAHGEISASPLSNLKAGATVTLSVVNTDEGYQFVSWSVKDASENDVTVTNNAFTMPASDVTVSATFKEIEQSDDPIDESFTIKSDDVVTNSGYADYTTTVDNRDWVITFGGNNKSVGTNSGNRSKCTLSSYSKYAVSPVTTSDIASAFACTTKLLGVKKIGYTINGGSNQTSTNVYVLYSADGNTFSQVSLTSGTQGAAISSVTTFEFAPCDGYFAVLFKATNSSGNWRIDDVDLTFTYEVKK